ncbi:MAG: hypothetical protein CO013_14245 [Syntrophobacterales bacterium CG_4_8_14_3_um_filter_58_8]|nr:MAG: hypothetical protein AUK26_13090 [Syntrophaceae bacterium CG2_30_58_14]PIV01837.1 MAG: hypothetical protein COS57_13805 [Syntrophobacterales bacterium CG03_land_8_20_14_0_80_58_14]PJC71509.1 MAG: hypothetical protein CO013_14245 [Syntrophobacterales bacterium CG_4_8_14_3_um_filter_58_8]
MNDDRKAPEKIAVRRGGRIASRSGDGPMRGVRDDGRRSPGGPVGPWPRRCAPRAFRRERD